MHPLGAVHAPPKRLLGSVNFYASAPCTISFSNDEVFGMFSKDLVQGDNFVDVEADPDPGQEVGTNVSIEGCPGQEQAETMSASHGRVGSGPTDIIVP
jgi:hypothetical protein